MSGRGTGTGRRLIRGCALSTLFAFAAATSNAAATETRAGAPPAAPANAPVHAKPPARTMTTARPTPNPPFSTNSTVAAEPPHHSIGPQVDFGGEAELRLGHDRVLGVGNPDLLSVSRVSGFAAARLGHRMDLEGAVAYDRATDDVILERARLAIRFGASRWAQVGVLPLPLLEVNLRPDATAATFAERSLVATSLIGVPSSQFGLGVRGYRPRAGGSVFAYELDAVAG